MPSKKKHSRNHEASASPRTPASSMSVPDTESIDEEELRCRLVKASVRFPCLIGESAFIGRINDVASESIRGFKIWLSETSMVAASVSHGSTVSVSLASSVRRLSTSFPLSSITGEYGIDSGSSIISEPGNFFVLATVFSSSKVLKDAVCISLNLHYGLGCPVSGRTIFIYPVRTQSLTDTVKESDESLNTDVNHLSLLLCKELYLELTPFRNTSETKYDLFSKEKLATESPQERFQNGNSTPMTPGHVQKHRSRGSNLPASPVIEGSVPSISNHRFSPAGLIDVQEVLTNESTKKLLQTCATSWLYLSNLLYGNFVAIPILSEMCIFCVKGANKLHMDSSEQGTADPIRQSVHIQALESAHLANYAFMVNQETKVYFHQPLDSTSGISVGKLSCLQFDPEHQRENKGCEFPKLGGLSKESADLKDIIVSSSMENSLSSLGLRPTKGVLLHGPPGTGKTTLARSCARDSGVNFFSLNGPEIVSQYFGESEKALHEIFSSASKAAPSVVFIDELDAIAPSRTEGSEELSQRMVATLLNLMDGISRSDGVIVIAATNRPECIEPALRRPGRLDREIEIGVPSPGQRFDILHTLLDGMQHSLSEVQVQQLAMATHGFVGADLAALCNEAALICLRRYYNMRGSLAKFHPDETPLANCKLKGSDSSTNLAEMSADSSDPASSSITDSMTASGTQPSFSLGGSIFQVAENIPCSSSFGSEKILGKEEHALSVAFEDFENAKMKIRPSAMREVILEVPKVNWDDVGGQKEVKNQLMEAVEWPQKHHDAFKRIGTRPPTGILMFGPPGCSKTLMARAVASEARLNFLAVKGPELFSKWVGESEKAVSSLFAKARANAPSIIFFDEIDGLAISRGKENDGISVSDRVMSQLLVEMDGLHERVDVTVIAATNRPDKIDPALLRPGRFDRLLYVGPPNEADREEIFKIHLRRIPCSSDISLKALASLTESCTGADISWICREAALAAMEESLNAKEITMQHLKTAISYVEPTEIQSYKELSAKFQRLVHSNTGEEVDHPEGTSRRPSSRLWTQMKSIAMFFFRLITS